MGSVSTRIIDTDRGWKKLAKQALGLGTRTAIAVGVQGDNADADHGGPTNVMVASVHEFGTDNIPERSFIRSAVDANHKKYDAEIARAVGGLFDGKGTLKGELMLIGEGARLDIINKIRSNIPPPLKEETIARKKGKTTALIDTGQLLNAISYELCDPRTKQGI